MLGVKIFERAEDLQKVPVLTHVYRVVSVNFLKLFLVWTLGIPKDSIYLAALRASVKLHVVRQGVDLSYLLYHIIIVRAENKPCRLGAGHANAHLGNACVIIKSGMLSADIAKILLAHSENYFAKSPLVKMRTPVALSKPEMRSVIHRNAVGDDRAVSAAKAFVFFEGVLVDVYFPTDATGVLASVGGTFEIFVILRGIKLHGFSFLSTK